MCELLGHTRSSLRHAEELTVISPIIRSRRAHDEVVIEHVAAELGALPEAVREANFYQVGQTTPGGNVIGSGLFDWTIPALWANAKADAGWDDRRAAVTAFNAANRWRKRGLCLMPVKYNIGETGYQVPVYLRVYSTDGTIEITHGGIEMGP